EENLAVRAARAVLEATGQKSGAGLELTKRIPVRAGLGGGSSDAAAALHAVNLLAGNAVPSHELLYFATRLGADVAFFASGAPCAVAWGRGERLFRFAPPPAMPALIAMPSPPVGVATPDAYRWWDEMHPDPHSRGPFVLVAAVFPAGGVREHGAARRRRHDAGRKAAGTDQDPYTRQSPSGAGARRGVAVAVLRPASYCGSERTEEPMPEQLVGTVVHYFKGPGVAVVRLAEGTLAVGESIRF